MRFNQHNWVMAKAYWTRPTNYSHFMCDTYSVHASVYIACAVGGPPEKLRGGTPQEVFKSNDCVRCTLSVIQQQ